LRAAEALVAGTWRQRRGFLGQLEKLARFWMQPELAWTRLSPLLAHRVDSLRRMV